MSDPNLPAAVSARIDRLPSSGPLWSWIARISFGAFFEIYEVSLTSLMAPLLVHAGIFHSGQGGHFGLPDLATFGFATFLGLFLGAIVFSTIADRLGRRPIFTYALIWYALATLVMATRSDALSICVWRFVAAIGVGAEVVAVDAYISEMMPKAMRGRGFAISKAIQYCAVPLAGILAAILARKTLAGVEGWRIMLLVPTVGAAFIWWVRRGLPESPRWLVEHGRSGEADAILNDIEAAILKRVGAPLPPVGPIALAPTEDGRGYVELFQGQLLKRSLMLLVVSCATTVAVFGFSNWLPSLLEARGVEVTKSLTYTSLIALSYPLSPLLFSSFADTFERKHQIAVGAGIAVVAGLLFAVQTAIAGWLAFGLIITAANNLSAYATHTYRSELFPTRLRARGVGLIYAIDRLVAAFNSYLVGFILVGAGVTGVLLSIAGASVTAMLVVTLLGPRTRGLAVDAIRNA